MSICLVISVIWTIFWLFYAINGAYTTKMSQANGVVYTILTTLLIGVVPSVIFLIIASLIAIVVR